MIKTIFGITPNFEINPWEESLELVEDFDTQVYYQTKETFSHEEEGLTFKYKFAVSAECLDEYGKEFEGKVSYRLYLVLMPESISEKMLSSIKSSCGIEEPNVYDFIQYGATVPLADEDFDNDELHDEIVSLIAAVIPVINSLRGFYIDKRINMIGTTGWDLIDSFINDTDPYLKSLERNR